MWPISPYIKIPDFIHLVVSEQMNILFYRRKQMMMAGLVRFVLFKLINTKYIQIIHIQPFSWYLRLYGITNASQNPTRTFIFSDHVDHIYCDRFCNRFCNISYFFLLCLVVNSIIMIVILFFENWKMLSLSSTKEDRDHINL